MVVLLLYAGPPVFQPYSVIGWVGATSTSSDFSPISDSDDVEVVPTTR
jgi:hypothetical protein